MTFPTAPTAAGQVFPAGSTDPRYIAVGDPPKWVVAGRNTSRPAGGADTTDLGPLTAEIDAVKSRLTATEAEAGAAQSSVRELVLSVADVSATVQRNVRVPFALENESQRVTVEIAGYEFDFDWITGSLEDNPRTAPLGRWRLMHESDCIPYVPDIARYFRAGQEVFFADGSEYRLLRDFANATDIAANPSEEIDSTLWQRQIR